MNRATDGSLAASLLASACVTQPTSTAPCPWLSSDGNTLKLDKLAWLLLADWQDRDRTTLERT